VLLFGRGPELGLLASPRGSYPGLLLLESLLLVPGHDRGSGFRLVSGLPVADPGAGLLTPAPVVGLLAADLVAGRALLSRRGPKPGTVPGPLLFGSLFLVLGQGRWSGFLLTSGFPMADPGAGLPMPVLIVGRLVVGRDVGLYVLSPRGPKPAAPRGSLLPVKALLFGRGLEDVPRPSSRIAYPEPLLLDSLLLVLAQER
jgi:hypothetical protein